MSIEFLQSLNGSRTGLFHRWMQRLGREPRIAWYPSAGEDFRDLMYLHPNFQTQSPASQPEPTCPDLFLHTDYFPWESSSFLDSNLVYEDHRTSVHIRAIEELPRIDLPLDKDIVHFTEGSFATGRVLFLELEVRSDVVGSLTAYALYAFAENAVFCVQKMLSHGAKISHVINVRYGGGLGGGGYSTGAWLLNVLDRLQCEVLISDGHWQSLRGDQRIYQLYHTLAGSEDLKPWKPIRVLPGVRWSRHGDVSWCVRDLLPTCSNLIFP